METILFSVPPEVIRFFNENLLNPWIDYIKIRHRISKLAWKRLKPNTNKFRQFIKLLEEFEAKYERAKAEEIKLHSKEKEVEENKSNLPNEETPTTN